MESFKGFAAGIHEKAKELVVKDGHHAELLMFVPLNGPSQIVRCRWQDRDAFASWVRGHVHKHYIYGVVHIAESWMRLAESLSDPTMRRLAAGEIRVSELPPDKRIEALVVMAQSRDGYSHTWVEELVRQGSRVKLGRHMEFDNPAGRFGNLFQ